jgi:hypothetical protein
MLSNHRVDAIWSLLYATIDMTANNKEVVIQMKMFDTFNMVFNCTIL